MSLVLYDPNSVSVALHQQLRLIRIDGIRNREFEFYQSGSGTGGLVWPASELLSKYLTHEVPSELDEWLQRNSQGNKCCSSSVSLGIEEITEWRHAFWSTKSALELGAGLGVLANTLLHLDIGSITATDGEDSVVEQMRENLMHNFGPSSDWRCKTLKWGDTDELMALPEFKQEENGFDIVFATDVVFGENRDVWKALGDTIYSACMKRLRHLKLQEGKCEKYSHLSQTIVFIAQTRRYPNLEKEFYDILEKDLHFKFLFEVDISGKVGGLCGLISDDNNVDAASRSCVSDTVLKAYCLNEQESFILP